MRTNFCSLLGIMVLLASCSQQTPPPEAAAQLATGQLLGCSRDIDCKGDRICDKAICVAPKSTEPTVQPDSPREASIKSLEEQLRCNNNPEPGKTLLALIDNGVLNEPSEYGDGVPVLLPIGDVHLFGHKILSVHGFEDNQPTGRSGELFPRGPGTSPGFFISVELDAHPDQVNYIPARRADSEFNRPYSTKSSSWYNKNGTEIQCNGDGV